MIRSEIKELHFIAHIDNLPSIVERGILCHNRVKKIQHTSVADQEIQDRRDKVVVPGGLKLHDYVNLYFNARNPMMYKIKGRHRELCVLQIYPAILDEPKIVISDGNASSEYTRFYPSPEGVENLDKSLVYAENWIDSNRFQYWHRKSAVCAEVLVPYSVLPKFLKGIYVSCQDAYQKVTELLKSSPPVESVSLNPKLFFL
ncbi:MAG: DUF4433 domain-containing protein [Candidatus Brocadiaceae bacterium]|nr:DUF4433 domain-containing protein [Candidatus Brocadiaceae bacterium]